MHFENVLRLQTSLSLTYLFTKCLLKIFLLRSYEGNFKLLVQRELEKLGITNKTSVTVYQLKILLLPEVG